MTQSLSKNAIRCLAKSIYWDVVAVAGDLRLAPTVTLCRMLRFARIAEVTRQRPCPAVAPRETYQQKRIARMRARYGLDRETGEFPAERLGSYPLVYVEPRKGRKRKSEFQKK